MRGARQAGAWRDATRQSISPVILSEEVLPAVGHDLWQHRRASTGLRHCSVQVGGYCHVEVRLGAGRGDADGLLAGAAARCCSLVHE
jgi:hypothetical protein